MGLSVLIVWSYIKRLKSEVKSIHQKLVKIVWPNKWSYFFNWSSMYVNTIKDFDSSLFMECTSITIISQNSVSVRHDSWTPVLVCSMACVHLNLFYFFLPLINNCLNSFHWCALIGSLTTLNNVQLVIFSLYNSIFQEPMSHGYLYACGLFLTTFCSAFINSQFNYWVRKIFFNFSDCLQ